jgi:hypothetical protein
MVHPAEAMKFANKYELFEAVTSGRVETFFARDLASGERVLLHIFEAPEQKPDQPTVQWVLESFRSIAPNPPGLVVEAGRYSGTTYAYLVTKLPDNAALQLWAQSYESCVAETEEIAIPSGGTSPANPATSKDLSQPNDRPAEESIPVRSAKPPGDFTAAFSVLAPRVNSQSEANTSRETDLDGINFGPEQAAPRPEPGDFTRQFFSGSHESPQKLATQAPAKLAGEANAPPHREVPRIGTEKIGTEKIGTEKIGAEKMGTEKIGTETQEAAKAEGAESPRQARSSGGLTESSPQVASPDSGGFTALFRSTFKPETKATSESVGAPRKPDDANAGNFTDFFRGPFDGERPAETPNILPKVLDTPQRQAPGEFTRVFGSGSGKDGPFTTTPTLQDAVGDTPREDEPGAFAQLFPAPSQPATPSLTNAPLRTWEPMAPKSEKMPPSMEPAWTPPAPPPAKPLVTPSIEPILPKPTVSSTLREAEPSLPDGATHVFSPPGGRPASGPPPLPAGPSEYTRIIKGGMGGLTPPEESPIAGGSQTPLGGPPAFKLPPAPKIAAPPPPKFSPPAVPPAPKAPQFEIKAPKPKASYLPLVMILTMLSIVAILLIMYFAIKR